MKEGFSLKNGVSKILIGVGLVVELVSFMHHKHSVNAI